MANPQITNQHELPGALVRAITFDDHKYSGDISCTELIGPPRIHQLKKRHLHEISVDASERIWILLGRAVHYVLEHGAGRNDIAEERLCREINGYTISAQMDLFEGEKTLWDYKVTSTWTAIYNPQGKDEWVAQLNIGRWIFAGHGFDIGALKVCAILRDWSKAKVTSDPLNYPQVPVRVFSIPVWSEEQIRKYLYERINIHRLAAELPDDQLPPCTPEEMWTREDQYAVMKHGRKTAVRVLDSREAAEAYLKSLGSYHYIEVRPGKRTRCEEYCEVSPFCNIHKQYKGGGCNENQ